MKRYIKNIFTVGKGEIHVISYFPNCLKKKKSNFEIGQREIFLEGYMFVKTEEAKHFHAISTIPNQLRRFFFPTVKKKLKCPSLCE